MEFFFVRIEFRTENILHKQAIKTVTDGSKSKLVEGLKDELEIMKGMIQLSREQNKLLCRNVEKLEREESLKLEERFSTIKNPMPHNSYAGRNRSS